MAKKKIEELKPHHHSECRFCIPYKGGFLSTKGEPVLGDCKYCEYKVILNDLTHCKNFKNK